MSFMLLDRAGYVGDLASNHGLAQLAVAARGKPATELFLESGEIGDDEARQKVLAETEHDHRFNELRVLLNKGDPPFIISDGMAETAEEESE